MDLPDTLPGLLYLLACDPERERVTGTRNLDLLLSAAVLTDLLRHGLLRDEQGLAKVTGPAPAGLNPVLAEQLKRMADGRTRRWKSWIRGRNRSVHAVRADLAAAGWIRLEPYRRLGLFPATRVTVRNPRVRTALLTAVSAALRGPLSRVAPVDAAVVALADAARLQTVLTWRQRRTYRDRLADLAALTGPVPPALRQAVRSRDAAAS